MATERVDPLVRAYEAIRMHGFYTAFRERIRPMIHDGDPLDVWRDPERGSWGFTESKRPRRAASREGRQR